MKRNLCFLLALAIVIVGLTSQATTFFNDVFTGGSTINSASPASATATSTAYQLISSKSQTPTPTLTANGIKAGIAASTSGQFQIQALFATNAVALTQPGDNIQMTVVFTNVSGLLTEAGQLGFGLYNSGQVEPIAGGMNGTATTSTANPPGGVVNWQGYVAQVNYSGSASRIMTRPVQTGTTAINQDLITQGSSSTSYTGEANVGSTATSTVTLTTGAAYTEVFSILIDPAGNLDITNTLYAGSTATGTPLSQFGGISTNLTSTYLTSGFDGLAIGYFARASTSANTIVVSSISVAGSVTTISGPPAITQQPVGVSVVAGGSCPFNVTASGFSMTYQWNRNGTNLLNGGNISGATSSTLILNNVSPADVASGANGYYVTVTGAGGFSTNSVTNSLSLVTGTNLIWSSGSSVWDLNNTPSWQDANGHSGLDFNYGDPVTFNNTGGGGSVTLNGNFLSAATWTIADTAALGNPYSFSGSGSFAGTGQLIFNSGENGDIQMNLNNTHTGGTIVSNSNPGLVVYAQQYQVFGSGPLTLATPGIIEMAVTGGATVGISGSVIVNDNFTIQFDGTGSYAGVFFGDLSGVAGKTLTLTPQTTSGVNRIRAYGAATTFNANLLLNDASILFAPYQASGSQTYNGVISGPGAMMQKGTTSYFNGANTYSGGMNLSAGAIGLGLDSTGSPGAVTSGPIGTGPLLMTIDSTTSATGSGEVFASGSARTIGNKITYPSGTNNLTLIVGGTNNFTFTSPFNLAGADSLTSSTYTSRMLQITNLGATTFAGIISDSTPNFYGITKTGTGALYLNAANTYTGVTTNSAGLLAGSGSVAGSVIVNATNAYIGGGSASSPGTFAIGGTLTLSSGGGFFRLNRSGTSDQVSVSGTVTSTGSGIITVTNLGSSLAAGDKFTLFSQPVANGSALTVTGGGVNWTNKLALDGSIVVLSTTSLNPTNITFSVIGGNTLALSWPADHLGWTLQVQTNSLATGLNTASNAWSNVGGSASVNSTNITINPAAGAVFYRLVYP